MIVAWDFAADRAAEAIDDFARAIMRDVFIERARAMADDMAEFFEALRIEIEERIAKEKKTRARRSWSDVVARRVPDVPRRIAWTASLRAFA